MFLDTIKEVINLHFYVYWVVNVKVIYEFINSRL